MRDQREFNKMSEPELKQVAGGARGDLKDVTIHYRCPVCGAEKWVTVGLGGSTRPVCPACLNNGQEVKMTETR